MSNVGHGIARQIIDSDGDVVTVTGNRLDVNAYLSATPTIDIGDVSLLLGGTAADTGLGTYGAQTLRVTMAADDALLSAMNANLADIETLLTTIDSDTGTISTYAEATYSSISSLQRTGGGVAVPAGNAGIGALAVRNDTLEAYAGIADGDYTFLQASSIGALYVTGAEVENAAVQSQPSLVGGRYDSSARTLGDGDAGAVALNASGHVLMDVVDGGQLDTIIDTLETTLTAIETDQAAIEVLLTAIDSDTNNIQGAVGTDGSTGPAKVMSIGGTVAIGGAIQELQCDANGQLMVEAVPGSAGFPVQISDSSFAVADGNALGEGVLVQGDDGSDRKNIHVDASTGDVYTTHGITGGADGIKVVTTAGTDVVLGGDVACKKIDIQAQTDNTGVIAVGFTGVDATVATGTGIILYPGDTYSLEINNLNLIYIDSAEDGEGVRYTYFT